MSKDVKLLFDGDLLIVNANLCERGIREALESLYSAYRVRLRALSNVSAADDMYFELYREAKCSMRLLKHYLFFLALARVIDFSLYRTLSARLESDLKSAVERRANA